MAGSVRVTQLNVYPVKSCAGTPLEEAEIGWRGIARDREYMVVDDDGEFLTQREVPRLALIRPTLREGGVSLLAPGLSALEVEIRDHDRRLVRVWRDRVVAADQGAQAAEWLSTFLHARCRLVRLPHDVVRSVDPIYGQPTDQVSFADGYPVLLISEESLEDLNSRLAQPLPMNRFRPNVVVRGWGAPYGEDEWAEVRIGDDVRLSVVKACARCAITTTDQSTAERGLEPLRTLATYRLVERGVLFGQNLIPRSTGRIAIGNAVVMECGAQRAISSV